MRSSMCELFCNRVIWFIVFFRNCQVGLVSYNNELMCCLIVELFLFQCSLKVCSFSFTQNLSNLSIKFVIIIYGNGSLNIM